MLFVIHEEPVQKKLDFEQTVKVLIRLNVPQLLDRLYSMTKNKQKRHSAKPVTRLKGISLVQVLIDYQNWSQSSACLYKLCEKYAYAKFMWMIWNDLQTVLQK